MGLGNDADDAAKTQKMLMQVAMFLHRELPIRLAHRVRDLDSIPHLSGLAGTKAVRTMYARSFEEIRAAPTPKCVNGVFIFFEIARFSLCFSLAAHSFNILHFSSVCVLSTVPRERYFAELCQSIYARHSSVLLMMARSAYELRDRMKVVSLH